MNYKQDGNNNWRFDDLKNTILDQVLTYTLTVNVPNGAENVVIPITDQLPAGMQYVNASATPASVIAVGGVVPVVVSGEQWNLDGTDADNPVAAGTFAPTVGADGRSFSGSIIASGAAKLKLTYKVKITDKTVVEALLADAQKPAGGTGGFQTVLTNEAKFETETTKTASVNVNGNLAGPDTGSNSTFFKSSDWDGQKNFITDTDGNIVEPDANVTYTFSANLATWNGDSPAQTLTENVVVSDTLAAQAEWSTGTGFIGVTAGAIPGVTELTELDSAIDCTVAKVQIAAPGTYCIDGQVLRINIGQDKSTNVKISVQAKLTSLANPITGEGAGLKQTGTTTVKDGVPYRFRNVATFSYKTTVAGSTNKQTDLLPVELPEDRDNGINDSSAFSKEAVDPVLNVDEDSFADVKYKFSINTAKTPAVETLQITDDFDEDYFPLTADNLIDPNVVITGTYDAEALDQGDFDLSLVGGKLVIKFSEAGKAKLNPTGKQLDVYLTLRTRQFDGKETLKIKNFATLSAVEKDSDYWSEDESEATSYDAEIALEKRVWDKTDKEWTQLLKVRTNEDGTMVQNRFIYQIEFRSYDGYTDDAVIRVVDELDASAKFIGFVKSDDSNDWNDPNAAVDADAQTKNKIVGTFDKATNEVVLNKPQGTWYPVNETTSFRIMVELEEGTKQFVNSLSWNGNTVPPTKTVVDIVGQPSIDIEKWTAETVDGEDAPGPVYNPETGALTNDGYLGDFDTDPDPEVVTRGKSLTANTPQVINFTVSNDGPDRLLDIKVTDKVDVGDGVIENLVCDFPADVGTSTNTTWTGPMEVATQFDCTGTLTGVGLGETHKDTAKVTAIGEINPVSVEDEDEWIAHVKSFAVGDYVWIDSDRDGLQGEDESPLEGVKVVLLDAEGEPSDGRVVYTDERGRYYFDNLPAGTYQVQFTLTDEQGKRYRYTNPLVEEGSEPAEDSDAEVEKTNRLVGVSQKIVLDDNNKALTANDDYDFFNIEATEGIDPTWDAGVTEIQYAVGDYVWIDTNKDGVQDANEKPLGGVKVELLDGEGEVVDTTETDATGRYIFDRLFAGTYQVRFTLTPEQARWYDFTKTGSGNSANDSDAHVSGQSHIGLSKKFELGPDNLSLTQDYDRDFWASEGIDPTWDAGVVVKPENLAATGMSPLSFAGLLGGAGALLLGGALLTLRRRNAQA